LRSGSDVRRVVLSGITGHLGQAIARQLALAGVEVHGLTRQTGRRSSDGAHFHVIDGRVETLLAIFEAVEPDTVFHVASIYQREHQSRDVAPLINTNVLLGAQVLEAARRVTCPRFVTAGPFFQHFDTDAYRALNLYAATKQAFEDILAYYADAHGIVAAALTLYEIYSEVDHRPKFMRAVANALQTGSTLNLPEAEFWLDLLHVDDVAAAFVQVATALESGTVPAKRLHRYCVCSGYDVSGSDLISRFERIAGCRVNVKRGAFPVPERNMTRPWRGTRVPGWTPRVGLEEGIARILARPE
jgi:nucleoside-diphosphate-sugar epimerase